MYMARATAKKKETTKKGCENAPTKLLAAA
jgi:hypothetical protein